MSKVCERIVSAERVEDMISIFGSFDENIRRIEETLCVSVVNRDTELKVSGEEEAVDKLIDKACLRHYKLRRQMILSLTAVCENFLYTHKSAVLNCKHNIFR